MSDQQQQTPSATPAAPARSSPRLPPRLDADPSASAADVLARQQARDQRDAQMRGVSSLEAMRAAIEAVARKQAPLTALPRLPKLSPVAFQAQAALGLPFLMPGVAKQWPLAGFTPHTLREEFSSVAVRARVGDYVNTAFAADRAMQDMSMREYLELAGNGEQALPPYLGNLELRELNRFCHWPAYFAKPGPPRFWLGPAGTVTPLHADYDDNVFVQIWGSKRIFLAPPHHAALLYPRQASALLAGSPFDPEAPDYERFPLARQATLIEIVVAAGDLLYVPAGWFHQVRALTFSLSSNRWSRTLPMALGGATA